MPASKSLQQILGFTPLTEALRAVASGVPNPFPMELFTVLDGNRVLGDRSRYIRIGGERRTSKLVKYGAPPLRRTLKEVGAQDVRMMHTFESINIPIYILQALQSFERYEQDKGMDWLTYQFQEAGRRSQNTRVISTASVLRYGALYWDVNGNLLPSSSGASETYDFNVPATHKNQCNGNISASWALSNTDIPNDISSLQLYSLEETGMELTTCLYGKNVKRNMMANDLVLSYLSRNPEWGAKFFTSNTIPDGLFDIKWIPVWKSFYETDDEGTVSTIWNDDLATFMPDISQPDKMTWWAMFEGSTPVPRSIEIQREPMAAIKNFEFVFGMGSYCWIPQSHVSIECNFFDTWLPGLKNEKALFQCITAF